MNPPLISHLAEHRSSESGLSPSDQGSEFFVDVVGLGFSTITMALGWFEYDEVGGVLIALAVLGWMLVGLVKGIVLLTREPARQVSWLRLNRYALRPDRFDETPTTAKMRATSQEADRLLKSSVSFWGKCVQFRYSVARILLWGGPFALGFREFPIVLSTILLVWAASALTIAVDLCTGILWNRLSSSLHHLREALLEQGSPEPLHINGFGTSKVKIEVQLTSYPWSTDRDARDFASRGRYVQTGVAVIDSDVGFVAGVSKHKARLAAMLSPMVVRRLVGLVQAGATIEDGWMVVAVDSSARSVKAHVSLWAERAARLARYLEEVDGDPAAQLGRWLDEADDTFTLEALSRALRLSTGNYSIGLAKAWGLESRFGDRQGELLDLLGPDVRAELAEYILTISESPAARADAIFAIARHDAARFAELVGESLRSEDVALMDALAGRAERWAADEAWWRLDSLQLDVPEWARIALARILMLRESPDARAWARTLLESTIHDRRGRVMEHLLAMKEGVADEDLRRAIDAQIALERRGASGRSGGLALSEAQHAGEGDVSLSVDKRMVRDTVASVSARSEAPSTTGGH